MIKERRFINCLEITLFKSNYFLKTILKKALLVGKGSDKGVGYELDESFRCEHHPDLHVFLHELFMFLFFQRQGGRALCGEVWYE